MKKLFLVIAVFYTVVIFPPLGGQWGAFAQNIGINTTGAAPTTPSMLEILQPSATASSNGLYVSHTGAVAGSTGYALQALKSGASLNNIAAYLSATGATNNYALIVPPGGGNVGIGTITPTVNLDVVQNGAIKVGQAYLSSGGDYTHLANNEYYNGASWVSTGSPGVLLQLTGQNTYFYRHNGAGSHTFSAVIDASGNMGVGNSSPSYRLDVDAPANNWKAKFGGTDGYILMGPANAGWAHIYTDRPNFIFDKPVYSIGNAFSSYSTGDLYLQTGGTTRITAVNSNGNVGIGLTNPAYNLEINGSLGYGDGTAGSYRSRTETRNDAGQMATQSGFFQTSAPAPAGDWPAGASSWWHLLDIRHSNPANNYAMQFAGSFFDQNLYFRKTNNNAAQGWSQILTSANNGDFIQNQYGGAQSANYWISGEGRVGSWFRNSASGTGLYNETNGRHFYSDGSSYWSLTTGNGLIFRDAYASTIQGYIYNDGTNFGILHRGGGWGIGTSTTRAFVNQSLMVNGSGTPSYALHVLGDVYANGGWFRVSGNQGLYWESWGPGWYVQDGTWLRTYNNASIWANTGTIATNGSFSSGYGGASGPSGGAIFAGKVGINQSSPDANSFLDVKGISYLGDDGTCGSSYRISVGWYNGCNTLIRPETNGWSYVGTASNAFWRMYSYGWVTASRREIKRNITPLNDDLYAYVMSDIDNIKPSFYKYKIESDILDDDPTHYRPNFHLGVILDESPDYIQDESFSGIDIYSLATLGIAGVKHNRKEIKEIKDYLGMGNETQVSDFGITEMTGAATRVYFSDDFKNKISSGNNFPVITVTPSNANASLYITEVSSEGFIVNNSTINQSPVTFNWIAMAKVKSPVFSGSEESHGQISPDLLNQLRVPEATKTMSKNYFMNLKPTPSAGQ